MFFGWGHEHTGRRFKHRVLGDTSCEEQMSTGWPESNWFGGGLEGLDITRKSLYIATNKNVYCISHSYACLPEAI